MDLHCLCRDKVSQELRMAYEALKNKYVAIFRRASRQDPLPLASAWYFVAYNQNRERQGRPFLSFPWLIAQWLCQIKKRNRYMQYLHRYLHLIWN